ncbi:MAG: helix-turn-helix transcriptional regulator [Bryobacterales bacterium]|nr:helix-turn-helix transcriptional regulator [Bryobacterales bacterium]
MKRIKNNYAQLLREKRARDGYDYTHAEVADIVGINLYTSYRMADGKQTRFDESVLIGLCDFLGCTLGDLLEYDGRTEPVAEATP